MKCQFNRYSVLCSLLLLVFSGVANAGVMRYEHTQLQREDGILQSVVRWLRSFTGINGGGSPSFRWVDTLPANGHLSPMSVEVSKSRTMAPGGMFRRVEKGTYLGWNTPSTSQVTRRVAADGQNFQLVATLPANLTVGETEVVWRILPLSVPGALEQRLVGTALGLSLPIGQYRVALNIGNYEEQKVVAVVPDKQVLTTFVPQVGRLQLDSELSADWEVFRLQQNAAPTKVLAIPAATHFSGLLAEGDYDVIAMVGDAKQLMRVRLDTGGMATARMDIPTGRINLMATVGDSPAMRPMGWKVFRLDGGRREIASPMRYSASLLVPPGRYEAVAELDGKQRSREFTVTKGTHNSIVIAMD